MQLGTYLCWHWLFLYKPQLPNDYTGQRELAAQTELRPEQLQSCLGACFLCECQSPLGKAQHYVHAQQVFISLTPRLLTIPTYPTTGSTADIIWVPVVGAFEC